VTAAYALTTSVVQGGQLTCRIQDGAGAAVTVHDAVDGREVARDRVAGSRWQLDVPAHWRSSLYYASFGPGPDCEAHFVVRAARPTAPILLSVPFATWQAYNRFDVQGEGLYAAESPDRAVRVSFDRPGGGPPTERWEHGLMAWLRANAVDADYCSNLDLHDGVEVLSGYRLLVVNGHDEYWTKEMRDTVETFTRRGGNVAFFASNTAWWQIRLEDDKRTMVCYRDALADPMSTVDPERVTVEWSSAPVNRPENTMTGLSFRRGAGAWGPAMPLMRRESYTARFTDHWVFDGTGLADGDLFGRGCLGYETDAADVEERDGVPRATGRDGTPPSFVVLATADLSHWARYGQGGAATMGIFTSGAGTVFNTGTLNWGGALDDPVVDRITRNVLDRLSVPGDRAGWTVIGPGAAIRAMTVCDTRLFAVLSDGALVARELCGQNLRWRRVGRADGVVALASPREAVVGGPLGLYGVTAAGRLSYADATEPYGWTDAGEVPEGTHALATVNGQLVAADRDGLLWTAGLSGVDRSWQDWGKAGALLGLTAMNGRLYALADGDQIVTRLPSPHGPWRPLGPGAGCTVLAAGAGRLIGVSPAAPGPGAGKGAGRGAAGAGRGAAVDGGVLLWREVLPGGEGPE
jgi:hypothetical protein